MGREKLEKKAPGVFGRYYASGTRALQLQFTFRGVRCRETMPGLDPDIRNHVKSGINILGSIKRDIDRGTMNYLEYFPDSPRARLFGHAVSRRTVREVGDSWLADMKRSLPHSTYRNYSGICTRFLYPALGEKRIRDVTVDDLRDLFRNLDVCLKTARNYSIPVRATFVRGLDDDDIERNPFDRVNVKSLIPREKHKTDYAPDPFEPGEINRILEAVRRWRPEWFDYFVVAFYTGLRTSEQYGLEWPSVTFDLQQLRVVRAVVEREEKDPKTRSSERDVFLMEAVVAALRRQRARTEAAGAAVFRNPNTGKSLDDYEISQRALDYCANKAGVRRRNQYQTRHTYASNLLSQGENPAFIAKQLGHKGVETVFRIYGRWVSDETSGKVQLASLQAVASGKK